MSLQRLDDILVPIANALRGAEMSDLIDKVNKVLYETLMNRYIDDSFYLEGEWRLTGLWHNPSGNCYFALVEVDTPDPRYRTSLYQIDVESGEIQDQEGEFALWAGHSSVGVPPESQEISLSIEV